MDLHDLPYYAPYLVVLDTNRFAWDFSRQLAAFVTGAAGDDGIGVAEARAALEEFGAVSPFQGLLGWCAENTMGYNRPVTILPTPGTPEVEYNSVALLFTTRPDDALLRLVLERARRFCRREGIALLGLRLLGQHRRTDVLGTLSFEGEEEE